MKALWEKLVERTDALSLRERIFLFLSLLACLLAVADLLWLTPAQNGYKQLTQRFSAQNAELTRLRDELRGASQTIDPAKAVRDDIAASNLRLAALNEEIKTLVPMAQNGPALEQVLIQLLRRQEGLALLGVRTLAQESAPASGTAANAALPSGLTKRGLELRVAGPYPALVGYVKALEVALPTMRWGVLQLKSDKQPPELTVQVYVVGVQP
jgi:MSHA biogenesis protein MshJ